MHLHSVGNSCHEETSALTESIVMSGTDIPQMTVRKAHRMLAGNVTQLGRFNNRMIEVPENSNIVQSKFV